MNVRLLVDGIVRQTTVLIAQLSTTAGVRAPLSHIADQVFVELAREIEAQGIGRKVVADMFGMALRAYQKKLQRLQESGTDRNQTLWRAVLEFLREGSQTRERIFQRFQYDGEREVGAVLNDLVGSGLAYSTGRGEQARYGVTTDADRLAIVAEQDSRALEQVVWLRVFLGEARTEDDLARQLGTPAAAIEEAVASLVRDGRVHRAESGELEGANFVVPVGASEGWEAAVLDHFRAAATSIAQKASLGARSANSDEVGGGTVSLTVYPGHPLEAEARALLRTVRALVHDLWNKASAYNAAHEVPDDATRVTFYFGQMVTPRDPSEDVEGTEP
jgi:hypothetical protein